MCADLRDGLAGPKCSGRYFVLLVLTDGDIEALGCILVICGVHLF